VGEKCAPGVVAFQAIYRDGAPAQSVAERRQNLLGFVAVVFHISAVVEDSLKPLQPAGIDIALFEEQPRQGRRLLDYHPSRTRIASGFAVIPPAAEKFADLVATAAVELGGRRWLIQCTPASAFFKRHASATPWALLASGLLSTVFFSGYLFLLTNQTARVQRLVDERTRELRENQERLTIVSSLPHENPDVIFRIATGGDLLYANPAGTRVLDAWGFRLGEPVPADWMGRVQAAVRDGTTRSEDVALGRQTFLCTLAPLAAQGYVNIYARDITDRKRAEEARQLDEARLEALLRLNQMTTASIQEIEDFTLAEGVRLTRSRIGYLAFLNADETVLTMHSWSKTAMQECAVVDKPLVYPIETTGLWGEAVRQRKAVITNDYAAPNPFKKGHPQGHVPILRHMNVPLFDEGRIVGLAGVGNKEEDYDESDVRQLTLLMQGMWRMMERTRQQEALRKQELSLHERQASKMELVGQLAGGVAHEFNNLLQAIGGYTRYAMQGLAPEEDRFQDLRQVVKATDRAATLTRQLLGFGRRRALERRHLDPNQLILDLVKMVRPVIGEHIEIQTVLQEDPGMLYADAEELQQVLLNLCLNARDAMPSGGKLLLKSENISLADALSEFGVATAAGRYVVLNVTDTGHGMTAEIKQRIFEPFFTTKEVGKGTGLGLANVHGVIQQHGGTIHVYSEVGKGTTFRLFLPRVEASAEPEPVAEPAAVAAGHETILVAEDESIVRNLAVRMLHKAGYAVLPACDGEEALGLLYRNRAEIDLVLLDAVMPKLSGDEVLRRLQTDFPEIKVLLCTGYDPDSLHCRYAREEGFRLLQKPFDEETLLRMVREILTATEAAAAPAT
jgi:signal transduction histidine kinase/CheY-like chemotaxis protein/PAS domain-containing protein